MATTRAGRTPRAPAAAPPEKTKRPARARKPAPPKAMFDSTDKPAAPSIGSLEFIALDAITLAENPRHDINPADIEDLSARLLTTGQVEPCGGRRNDDGSVTVYTGQQRKLAADLTHELVKTPGFSGHRPVEGLWVLLRDDLKSVADWRRYQAQENSGVPLSIRDKQDQFAFFWEHWSGLPEDERLRRARTDAGIGATEARDLLRQLSLPEEVRRRVARRPRGDEISVALANTLAEIHDASPPLAQAIADWVTTEDRRRLATRDVTAVIATVSQSDEAYAVRLHAGTTLDTAAEIHRAVRHLPDHRLAEAAHTLGTSVAEIPRALAEMATAATLEERRTPIDQQTIDRAANGHFAYVANGAPNASDATWLVDPLFMIDLAADSTHTTAAKPPAAPETRQDATTSTDSGRPAADRSEASTAEPTPGHLDAVSRNLGLGDDIAAQLTDPTADQLAATRDFLVHLVSTHLADAIAYGAGWTDRDRMQRNPTGGHDPLPADAILDVEIDRALRDDDPMRGLLHLVARAGAALMLDPEGTRADGELGRRRIAPRLDGPLTSGANPLGEALWRVMKPMLSPALEAMHGPRYDPDAAQD